MRLLCMGLPTRIFIIQIPHLTSVIRLLLLHVPPTGWQSWYPLSRQWTRKSILWSLYCYLHCTCRPTTQITTCMPKYISWFTESDSQVCLITKWDEQPPLFLQSRPGSLNCFWYIGRRFVWVNKFFELDAWLEVRGQACDARLVCHPLIFMAQFPRLFRLWDTQEMCTQFYYLPVTSKT